VRRRRREPLLCELHAHSRWSDGAHSIRELVALYGQNGFDVLCITDHLVRVPAVVDYLRSTRPAYFVHLARADGLLAAA
jgi:histidinol phosphatase-like PHP family hydrolase